MIVKKARFKKTKCWMFLSRKEKICRYKSKQRQRRRGGNTKEDNGGEMINVHYIQISKCPNETHYLVQLHYSSLTEFIPMCLIFEITVIWQFPLLHSYLVYYIEKATYSVIWILLFAERNCQVEGWFYCFLWVLNYRIISINKCNVPCSILFVPFLFLFELLLWMQLYWIIMETVVNLYYFWL